MDVGDTVLHPRYGVGIIDGIEKRVLNGEAREYYVIPKPALSSTIFVPVDNADELGLRPVATPEELKTVISILSGELDEAKSAAAATTAAARSFSWGDPESLARTIRRKATEPKPRYPKVSEQQQLKRAKKLLAEEVSVVLGMSEESAMAIVDGEETTAGAASGA